MRDPRTRLVVLFGGRSAEHDVSCVSARHVLAALDTGKYRVEPMGITREGRWVRALDAVAALDAGAEALPAELAATGPEIDPLPALADEDTAAEAIDGPTVVFPVLHGPLGEDGTIQGLLELADVAYVGAGVLASALCMDKTAAKLLLAQAGVAQARWHSITLHDPDPSDTELEPHIDTLVGELGLPAFVKPANMGSSVGVSRVTSRSGLADALRLAGTYDRLIVIEEEVRGREIEVAVLGNDTPEASVAGEIVPGAEFYDYADKYEDGADLLIPAPLGGEELAEVQTIAVTAYRTLRVEGLARVDFFYEDGTADGEGRPRGERGWLVNELNTMPGFTPISMYPKLWAASGLPYPKLIDRLVDLALERHARRLCHSRTDR